MTSRGLPAKNCLRLKLRPSGLPTPPEVLWRRVPLPHSRKSCNAIILSGLFSRAAEDADEEDGSLSLLPPKLKSYKEDCAVLPD